PDQEKLELLQEELEGAAIRLQIAKVKARVAEADQKVTREFLQVSEQRLKLYQLLIEKGRCIYSWEEPAGLWQTRDKYFQEACQKQGVVELSHLEVRYREWQYRRVEAAIKRLKAAQEK